MPGVTQETTLMCISNGVGAGLMSAVMKPQKTMTSDQQVGAFESLQARTGFTRGAASMSNLRNSRRVELRVTVMLAALAFPALAAACTVCNSETGQQVRAGIFGDEFWTTIVGVVAPFPAMLIVIAAYHYGIPHLRARGGDQAARSSALMENGQQSRPPTL